MLTEVIDRIAVGLSYFLRYLGSALVGYVVIRLAEGIGPEKLLPSVTANLVALLVLLAAYGVLIYCLHRGLLLPVISLSYTWLSDRISKWNWYSKRIDRDVRRWLRHKQQSEPEVCAIQKGLTNWADITHFLYCVAWACIFATLAFWLLNSIHFQLKAIYVGAFFLVCAIFSDVRQTAHEIWVSTRQPAAAPWTSP